MSQTKNRLTRMVSIVLFFVMCFVVMSGVMLKNNVAYAASDLVATFHFWQIGKGKGTRTDNEVDFQYSGIKANTDSNITIGANSSVIITVSEATINAKGITSGAFYIYASGISYTWTRGSTILKSGTIASAAMSFAKISETSIAGSGDLVLTLTNSTGSDISGVHFESPNYALYAAPKRSVSITAGTGVKSVYMSTSSTATSGGSSGTEYADGTKVYGFAKLDKGYSAQSGWTLVSGTANTENAIYCVGSKTISKSQKTFNTISADATNYNISYTLNGGALPSGYPASYTITTNTFSLSNPTRKGYTFAGWTGSNGSTKQTSVSIAKGSTGNKSYTANWTVNQYNITYKDQGNAAFSGAHESGYPTKHTYDTATALKGASKSYYRFDGWFTNQNCTGSAITSLGATAFTADITLYAKWTPLTFTVTFDQQNGTGGTSSVTATSGLAMPSATMPTREGYTFGGYFDGTNGSGTQYYSATGSSVTNWNKEANTTLYAYWIPIPATAPTITSQPQGFDANYGDGGTLTASASAASGHTVDGYQWYSSKTGSTSDGEPIASATAATYTIPKTQDVGTYYYYCVATSKRTDNGTTATTATGVVTVKLEKISAVLTKAPAAIEGLLYTSEAQVLAAAGTAEGGTVWYKLGSGSYATTIPTATLVDTYTVYYKVVGDKNHYDIAESSLQVKIAEVDKTALKAALDAANDYVAEISENYSGVAATLSLAIGDANTLYTNKNVTAKQVADKTAELLGKIDEAKAGVTMAKISAIGTVDYTTDCKGKIDAARDAYNALTDAQKAIVTNYKDLTDAEAAYEVAGKIAAIDGAVTLDSKAGIDAARTAYNNLTNDQKGRVGNYKDLTDAEAAYAVAEKIDAIDDVILSDDKDAIADARDAYDKLTDDQNVRVGNYGELTDSEAAYDVVDKIDAIGEVVYPNSKSAIDTARTAFNKLNKKQQEMTGNVTVLTTAEYRYRRLEDISKAIAVERAISAIGNVVYPNSKAAVESAREAYDALTEAQKSLVNNYDKLVAAEDKIAVQKVDYDVASAVDALIDAIGTVTYPDSKGAIDAARNAYNALTDAQKALVSKLAVLTAAETEYERLSDIALAKDATEKIDAIGTVSFTTTSKARIDAARKAYNALSTAQKALVENEAVLLAAEAEYEQLAEEAGKARLEQEKVAVTTADGSLIPVDIELKVEVKTDVKSESSHEDYSKAVAAFIDHNEKIAAVYDVKLVRTINGVEEEIQPSDIKEGTVIVVEMAIPEEEKGKEFKILHIHSEDDIELVEYTIENGNIHVHVDRLSQFAFVNAKDKGLSTGAVIAIVIASIIVAAGLFFLFFFLFKRRKEDDEEEKKTESKTKAK